MDDGVEACVSFVGSHRDTFELFEFAKEVFDEMTPFIEFGIDIPRCGAPGVLGDDDLGATLIQFGDDGVAVESLVGNQRIEDQPIEKRGNANRVEALSRQQYETHEIAERIDFVLC